MYHSIGEVSLSVFFFFFLMFFYIPLFPLIYPIDIISQFKVRHVGNITIPKISIMIVTQYIHPIPSTRRDLYSREPDVLVSATEKRRKKEVRRLPRQIQPADLDGERIRELGKNGAHEALEIFLTTSRFTLWSTLSRKGKRSPDTQYIDRS